MKMKRYLTLGVLGLITTLTVTSCSVGGGSKVELVDLDIVLDQFVTTMEELDANAEGATDEAKEELGATFITNYTTALNTAKMVSYPLGVQMREDGAFLGFKDKDNNKTKGAGEPDIFTVEIDEERKRLVATDIAQGYHRDHSGLRMAGSIFTGYMIGRMLTGQRGAGITSNKFSKMQMKPKGFHKTATANAKSKARASSARSSGGSKSFKTGK